MDNNHLKDWVDIIKGGSYDNTYKMAWARALTELSYEYKGNDDSYYITFDLIAIRVIKYYWNQTIFFNLIQGNNMKKPPRVVTIVKELIEQYQTMTNNTQPVRFERAETELIKLNNYKRAVRKVITTLKQDVSHRFLNLNRLKYDHLYYYKKGNDFLYLPRDTYTALKLYAFMLFDLINYRWTLMLENFNASPRIGKKVKIIDESDIRRASLSKYHDYLQLINPDKICFICQKPIKGTPSIDHVIPWSYMYSDDLWNLVYVHKSCNSIKGNSIPDETMIQSLKERNDLMLDTFKKINRYDKPVQELDLAIREDYVHKFWIGSK